MAIEFKTFRLRFAVTVGIVSLFLTWLFMNVLMDTYSVFNAVVLIWGFLNLIPGLIGAVFAVTATGNPHHPDERIALIVFYPLVFTQWAAIGYLLSRRFYKRLTKS